MSESRRHRDGLISCLKFLKAANDDNERLASLLMVAKVVEATETTETDRSLIFEAVGFTFVNRLLRTEKVPDRCSSHAFRSLSLTLLSCFCSVPQLVVHPEMLTNVPVFLTILSQAASSMVSPQEEAEDGSDAEQEQVVVDVLECLHCLAGQQQGCQAIAQHGAVSVLAQIAMDPKLASYHDRCWRLILVVGSALGPSVWHSSLAELEQIISYFSTQLKQREGAEKFDVCGQFGQLLTTTDTDQLMELSSRAWAKDVRQVLRGMMQSRLGEAQRRVSLQLAATMVDLMGVKWALEPDAGANGCKLLLLLTHLSCIEVRLILEGDPSKVENMSDLLCSCFSLLEHLIMHLASGPSLQLSQAQVQQLHAALSGGINAVIHYLKIVADQLSGKNSGVVLAAVRVLSVWISEETTALKDEVVKLLPFLLDLSRHYFQANIGQCKFTEHCLYEDMEGLDLSSQITKDTKVRQKNPSCDGDYTCNNGITSELNCAAATDTATKCINVEASDTLSYDCDKCMKKHTYDSDCTKSDNNSTAGAATAVTEQLRSIETLDSSHSDSVAITNIITDNPHVCNIEGMDSASRNSISDSTVHDVDEGLTSVQNKEQISMETHSLNSENTHGKVICKPVAASSDGQYICETEDAKNRQTCIKPVKEGHNHDRNTNVKQDVDVFGLLLPGLCHLTADDAARAVLLQNEVHVLLVQHLQYTWRLRQQVADSEEHQAGLTLGCGVLLNLAVLESQLTMTHNSFTQLLEFLTSAMTQFAGEDGLVLHYNMATLAIMLLQPRLQPSQKSAHNENCGIRVISECTRLFRGAHCGVPSQHDGTKLSVTEEQITVWDQVSELWFLGMQALSSCVSFNQGLAKELVASGWVQDILRVLLSVRGNGVDVETAVSYRSLLLGLSVADEEAKKLIMENGGPALAKMYQMEELQGAFDT